MACERELPWRERKASCCATCWAHLPKITSAKCASCALPLPGNRERSSSEFLGVPRSASEEECIPKTSEELRGTPRHSEELAPRPLCISCLANPLPLEWCEAWGEYRGPLERILGALKFERHDFLDDVLASLLEETLRARGDLAFDAIVAVPMPPARERRRGYNQADLLGRALSRRVGVGCDMTLLRRAEERATQSKLPKRERAANVRGAFAAASRVKGRSILVVDDICTTGETLRACATALLREGAARVCAVTVAKAS